MKKKNETNNRLLICLFLVSGLIFMGSMPLGLCSTGFNSPPGDANGDGVVNIDDIFFILGHWG